MNILTFIIIFIIILITLILLGSINIKLYLRDNQKVLLEVYFVNIYIKKINITKSLEKYIKNHNIKQNINSITNNIRLFINNFNIIKKYLKQTTIKKIIITLGSNTSNTLLYPYITILNYGIINSIKNIVHTYFKKVNIEYYNILNNLNKQEINIDILIRFRLINILFVSLLNYKEFVKLIKYLKKGLIRSGTKESSNQSVITNNN